MHVLICIICVLQENDLINNPPNILPVTEPINCDHQHDITNSLFTTIPPRKVDHHQIPSTSRWSKPEAPGGCIWACPVCKNLRKYWYHVTSQTTSDSYRFWVAHENQYHHLQPKKWLIGRGSMFSGWMVFFQVPTDMFVSGKTSVVVRVHSLL